jgi:nucleoside-diphosphate kinase
LEEERTLVILKPDTLERGLEEQVISYFTKAGLRVVLKKKIFNATREQLNIHFLTNDEWVTEIGVRAYRRIKDKTCEDSAPHFKTENPYEIGYVIVSNCHKYYKSGPLIALVLEGEDAVATARKQLGSALPSQAERGTIRGDLGQLEDPKSMLAARNLVHASDSVSEAEREMSAWFTDEELSSIE